MKKIWILIVAVSHSGICLAEDSNQWFVGFGIGSAEYERSAFSQFERPSSFSDSDALISLSGGYVFNEVFSVEAGYIDLGSVEDRLLSDDEVSVGPDTLFLEAHGITVSSKFSWQLTAPLALSAKLGVSVFDVDKQWSGGFVFDPDLASDTGGTETNVFFGVQLQYKLSDSWSLGLNWDRYDVEEIDVDGIYVNAGFHF